jgi:hypothetical protein
LTHSIPRRCLQSVNPATTTVDLQVVREQTLGAIGKVEPEGVG